MSDPGTLDALERALATVIDPELHKPMLQLGMLRDLAIDGGVASIRVVLTTPACPLKDRIQQDIDAAVLGVVPGITRVAIRWDADVSTTRGLPGRQEIAGCSQRDRDQRRQGRSGQNHCRGQRRDGAASRRCTRWAA